VNGWTGNFLSSLSIAASAIDEMGTMGINLVVPEYLKKPKETEHDRHKNVIQDFLRQYRRHAHEVLVTPRAQSFPLSL
jgi:hypothetical protein